MNRTPTTIRELELAAGITDRAAFWQPFTSIRGTAARHGRALDKGLEAGIAELRRLAAMRSAA